MINTVNLKQIYQADGIDTLALDDITMTIAKKEFTAIMGPSGCGKTTLLNILGLIDRPYAGKFYFNELDTSSMKLKERDLFRKKYVGYVFQNFYLIDDLTVYENIELPLLYRKIPSKKRKARVNDIIERLSISHRCRHFPYQLSGGQKQRVALARAVVHDPELILADEPTGNLDSIHGNDVMNVLSHLNREGKTIIMVTHSPEFALYAKRIISLFDGHIVAEKKVKEPISHA